MLITNFDLPVQTYNYVKVPSGVSFNYVSVYPAVALTFKKLIKLKAATGNFKDLAVGAITLARVYAAGLGELVDDICLADTCAGCLITRNLRNCFMMKQSSNYAVGGIGGADNKSISTHVGYLSVLPKCVDKKTGKDSTLWIQGDASAEPNVAILPDSPLNILSLNILYANGFRTNGNCSEMRHKYCPHKRVTIFKKDNLSYFKIAKIDDRD